MTKEQVQITVEYKDHDKIVLTNIHGDTYTSKSEELQDFFHKATSPEAAAYHGQGCSDPNKFEVELYELINKYVNAGLKKPDLVHKMKYVTESCVVS